MLSTHKYLEIFFMLVLRVEAPQPSRSSVFLYSHKYVIEQNYWSFTVYVYIYQWRSQRGAKGALAPPFSIKNVVNLALPYGNTPGLRFYPSYLLMTHRP